MWLDAGYRTGWHCQRLSEVTATRLAAFLPCSSKVFKNLTDDFSLLTAILKLGGCSKLKMSFEWLVMRSNISLQQLQFKLYNIVS
jgi:hypothetical protein